MDQILNPHILIATMQTTKLSAVHARGTTKAMATLGTARLWLSTMARATSAGIVTGNARAMILRKSGIAISGHRIPDMRTKGKMMAMPIWMTCTEKPATVSK